MGNFIKVNANESYNGQPVAQAAQALTANENTKNNVKQVGEFYIFYQAPQSSCAGNNAQLTQLITPAARTIVTEALQSLEVIE